MKQKSSAADVIIYIVCGLFAFVCIYPFYYVVINTISDNALVARGIVLFYPVGIHFKNYVEVFKLKDLWNATAISISRTVIGTGFALISASFLGYAMTKKEYWGRTFWYRFLIVTMYFNAGIIPWFMTMNALKLTNNFLAHILPSLVAPFYMILIKTYIESIPPALEESAQIDGAGYLRRYVSIVLPLTTPILATVAVFAAVGQWNSFMDTVFLMTDSKYFTLQFILYKYISEVNALAEIMRRGGSSGGQIAAGFELTPVAVRFTVTVITLLPIMLVYPFFQRYFVKGIMIGSVKG